MIKQFSLKKINNNICKIEEKWFKEHANLYLFGDKNSSLLIDAGLGLFDIKKFLKNKGFKNIKVALTHAHFDHFGGIKHFSQDEILLTKKMYKNLKDKHLSGLKFLNSKDFSPKINFSDIKSTFQRFSAPIKPKFINNIKIGKLNFKIIKVPGHTDDSVAYYDGKNGNLVTGDALYNGKIYSNFINSDNKKFKKSLNAISNLDFDLVFPGHNSIFNKKKALKIISKWEGCLGK